jgi:hypothetical protein
MSHKPTAITDFSHFHEEELGPTVMTISSQLTTNGTTFPDLPVAAATLATQGSNYTTILGRPDDATKTADLRAARTIVETSLKDNGVYINIVAKGDAVILAKSGYPISKPHQPIGPLEKSNLKMSSTDNAGEFSYEIEGVKNADGFLICLTLASNTETNPHKWQWVWCPKTRGIISGLESSKRYKAVSVGVGTDPQLNFSDPIERTTQ